MLLWRWLKPIKKVDRKYKGIIKQLIERMGDRCQDIAEYVIYMVLGTDVRHASPVLRQRFASALHCSEQKVQAWTLFFIALHDYGKLDVRFQRKAPETMQRTWPNFDSDLIDIKGVELKNYYHGPAGYSWFYKDFEATIGWNEYDEERWDAWSPWLAAVTGHHGGDSTGDRSPSPVKHNAG